MKEKAFAASVSRENIRECEKIGSRWRSSWSCP
jgi:predicted hydrolase (HD superfamily)